MAEPKKKAPAAPYAVPEKIRRALEDTRQAVHDIEKEDALTVLDVVLREVKQRRR